MGGVSSETAGTRYVYVGRGGVSWRDPRNWERKDGTAVRHLHLRGGETFVVSGRGVIDLRDCPAVVDVREFEGRVRLPGSRAWFTFLPRPSRRQRVANWVASRPARVVSVVPRRWQRSVRLGTASLVAAGALFVVPFLSGGASSWFWVPVAGSGTGTWNNSDASHWATTSGGAGGAGVPVAGDTVTFDANSGTAATVTVAATAAAATVTVNKSDLTLLHGAANTTWCTGALTPTTGTWNTGGFNLTLGSLTCSGAGTKTLTFGASAIQVTGATVSVNSGGSSGASITANSAVITLSGSGANVQGGNFSWSGTSIVFTGGGGMGITSGTFVNLTVTGTAAKTDNFNFQSAASLTFTGTVTLGGGSVQGVNRLLVQSQVVATQRTITAAAYVVTGDLDFMDANLAYSGGASWTNTGNAYIGDCGGNAGAVTTNATASVTQTATGTASFTWSTHGWTTRVPLPQDDVAISNAFVAGRTITVDMPRLGRTITSTCTGNPSLVVSNAYSIYGGVDWSGITTSTAGNSSTYCGRGAYTIKIPNQLGSGGGFTFAINAPGGTYTLGSDLVLGNVSVATTFQVLAGTFAASTFNVKSGIVGANGSTSTRVLNLGSGTWTLWGTGLSTVWAAGSVGNGCTIVPGTATIDITATDSFAKTFIGNGQTYPTLKYTSAGSGSLVITGNNTGSLDLECTTARQVTCPAGGTWTVPATGSVKFVGAVGQLLSFVSSTPGTAFTFIVRAGATVTRSNYSFSADINFVTANSVAVNDPGIGAPVVWVPLG